MRRATPRPCRLAGKRSGSSAEDKALRSWKILAVVVGGRAGAAAVSLPGVAEWCTLRVRKNLAGWRGLRVRQGPRSVPKNYFLG